MRNLAEFPITDQEIVACLKEQATKCNDEDLCGDMRAALLTEAADIIAGRNLGKDEFLAKRLEQIERRLAAALQHIQLHAGDTLSLDNEVCLFKDHFEEAERRVRILDAVAEAAAECIHDDRAVGGEVIFQMGGHRRIRLADALKAMKEC